jgi:Asp-tRNA(Asn)/Glu-tRNA(Gln) amidotransferase A subunit family amidase
MARFARFARLWNGLGAPALAMPAYGSREIVPAVQIAARPFDDAIALRLGAALEAARPS